MFVLIFWGFSHFARVGSRNLNNLISFCIEVSGGWVPGLELGRRCEALRICADYVQDGELSKSELQAAGVKRVRVIGSFDGQVIGLLASWCFIPRAF